MTRRWALLIAFAGCGDNIAPTDAAPAALACTATFTGNFALQTTADSCAMLASGSLQLTIPAMPLRDPLNASFDLGASPSPGAYSPDSVGSWTARGVQQVGNGVCVYNAGATAVPTGSFTLQLDAVDPAAHGSLQLVMYVLAYPGTTCGTADTEQLDLQF